MKFHRPLSLFAACLAVLLSWNQLQAQSCYGSSAPQNEIGIRLGSLTDASNEGGIFLSGMKNHVGFMNGLHYKRYGEFGAFRTSLGFTRFDVENRENCPECLITDGYVRNVKLRAGYEWFAFLGQFEPYIGLDAIAAFGRYEAEKWTMGSGTYRESTDIRRKSGFGLAPVAGIRLYLTYALSISAETSVEAMMFTRETTISEISPESSSYSAQSNYWETTFHPLNWISLNVLF